MGGAADLPQRSSSPLKRPASDLEADQSSSQTDDVDMISVPPPDSLERAEASQPTSRTGRAQSVDMLKVEPSTADGTLGEAGTNVVKNPETDIPSIDSQIQTITALCNAAREHQLNEGDKVYLVSQRWLQRVISRGTEGRKNSKIELDAEIGPVDSSDIIQQILKDSSGQDFARLKQGVGSEDFELFPQEAWTLVEQWYGLIKGTVPILRIAHNTNPDKQGLPNIQYEFHPPVLKLHKLFRDNNSVPDTQTPKESLLPAPMLVFSRSDKYHDFLKAIKKEAGVELKDRIRVWRVPRLLSASESIASAATTATPPSSRPSSPVPNGTTNSQPQEPQDSWKHLLLDAIEFTKLERGTSREAIDLPDTSNNLKYNGSTDLSLAGLGDDQTVVIDLHIGADKDDTWVSNYAGKSSKPASGALTRPGVATAQVTSGRNSPAPSGPITRGRAQKSGKTIGTVGLSNLGNTCYMNSALQCVRSVEELTKYFLTGAAKEELNSENPLGNNGDVAMAYGRLLEEIYKDPVPTSITPRFFKSTIGRYAPSFSGYGQQDSQEFLGFLLDGLQEDLSRVKKKPYIEKPDSTDEMVNNPAAIREMAAKVWDITKKRDDSVIADLFTGMYKSTLVCPICDKVSITFDPFNNLTLQLPIENSWSHKVLYYPLNDRPIEMEVDIEKSGSILTLKQFISGRVGVPVERLFPAEEFKHKFYRYYKDYEMASDQISTNDIVAVYELEAKPTNWPPQSTKGKKKTSSVMSYGNDDEQEVPHWDDPIATNMIVPVFHRTPVPERAERTFRGGYGIKKPWNLSAAPHFIMLNPEEARDEEVIRRKILEKVATFTTWNEFENLDSDENSVADSVDPDIVLTTGSDADSSGGSKVMATSVDSEDELVNVTMKDSATIAVSDKPAQINTSTPLFNSRRPKFLTPGSYLPATLQNMFTVGYCPGTKELIPSGWNTIDEEKTYPPISSRNPQMQQSSEDASIDGAEVSSARSSEASEEDSVKANRYSSTTRMAEESDEDEEPKVVSAPKALPLRTAGSKSGLKVGHGKHRPGRAGPKTYSKKQKRQVKKQQAINKSVQDAEQDTSDDGPLIRLGEILVVDWNLDAWTTVFGADGPEDNMRGKPTWNPMATFKDPKLEAQRKARIARRKGGISLDDCLDEFGKEEILSEMDTWYCPRCKEHRRASKKFELWKTPDILCVHLKRFSSSANRRDKLDVLVDFPIEGLDLTSRVIEKEEGKPEIYDLFAVDDHWGGLGGGHYTAFAKNFNDGAWYEYNDSSVSKQHDPSRVVSSSAYLLFYRRRSDVPLGGPRFQQIFQKYDEPARDASEDESSESGEDQRLGGNSSLLGSSSALTGVGAARHQPNGLVGVGMMTTNPLALDRLPDYQAHEENDEDAAPLLAADAEMNDGLGLHPSVENDEAIEMGDGMNFNNVSGQGALNNAFSAGLWDFGGINENGRSRMVSGTGSDVASDLVQNNSSASDTSVQARLADFENARAVDEDGIFIDQSPVPDMSDEHQAAQVSIHHELLDSMHQNKYVTDFATPDDEALDMEAFTPDDEALDLAEPAMMEIHIEDHDVKFD